MNRLLFLLGMLLAACGGAPDPATTRGADGVGANTREWPDAVREPLEKAQALDELMLERKGTLDEAIDRQAP